MNEQSPGGSRMRRRTFLKLATAAGTGIAAGRATGGLARAADVPTPGLELPPLSPIPPILLKRPVNSVQLADPAGVAEATLDFPIVPGPYLPTWDSIAQNYPGKEAPWLREAKFGIWVHFGPQAAGQSGDWYARKMYIPETPAYANHLRDFGHPSTVGYKDLLHTWNPTKLDPVAIVKLYKQIGARFLLIQGVHHDNFDNWDSKFQPWNSMNMGPKRDLLGEWSRAAHAEGMRYGVSFHHEYTWWWWQKSFGADATGAKAGVPYDGNLTLADGKGQWWEGLDPRLLYGIDLREFEGWDVPADKFRPEKGILTDHEVYCRWYTTRWAMRMMDVVRKYDPDFIYTDGDSTGPFSGYKTGTGYKCDAMQRVIADFYNHTLMKRGKMDTFSVVKFRPPARGVVNTFEDGWPKAIKTDQPWIGETAYGDWFYAPGFVYDAAGLIHHMLECVSRDGSFCINIAMRPDGSLDDGSLKMLGEVGDWMKVNGEAIYGSSAWSKWGESAGPVVAESPKGKVDKEEAAFKFSPGDYRFTVGKDGSVYVFCLAIPSPGGAVNITSLGAAAQPAVRAVKTVTLLGSDAKLDWQQQASGLQISCPGQLPCKIALVFKVGFEAA